MGYLKVPLFVTSACTVHVSTLFTGMAPAAPLDPASVLTYGYTSNMLNEEGHRCYLGVELGVGYPLFSLICLSAVTCR